MNKKIKSVSRPASKKKKLFSFPPIPFYGVLFILLWKYCAWDLGSLFYICQQHTYFAFDADLLFEVNRFWYGPLIIAGRFVMLLFHYPILGGFVYALVLTLISYLINYVLQLKEKLILIGAIIPFVWLFTLQKIGLNLFYHYEPSFIMYLPLLLLIILTIITGCVKIIKKVSFPALIKPINSTSATIIIVTLSVCLTCFTSIANKNTIVIAKLQQQLQNFEWNEMVETALEADQPTRPICAYYSLALYYSGQLNRTFELNYQYPSSKLTNRNDYEDIGTFYYCADVYLFMGLANPSWHRNIDHLTMEGLSAYKLKNLCLSAIVNKEYTVAEKIMYIIEQMPFESSFVDRFKPILYNPSLIELDPVLAKVKYLLPRKNSQEQKFFVPLFLGYYVEGNECLPDGVQAVSIASALYTKNLEAIFQICQNQRYSGPLEKEVEEAIIIAYMRAHQPLNHFNQLIVNRIQAMLSDAKSLGNIDKKQKAKLLYNKYKGTYAYYYFYQNIPDENYPEPIEDENENKIN